MTTADLPFYRRKTRPKKTSRFLQLRALAADACPDIARVAREFPKTFTINFKS